MLGAAALGLHPLARLSDGPQEDVVILQVNDSDYVSLLKLRLSISVVHSPQAKVDFVALLTLLTDWMYFYQEFKSYKKVIGK